MEVKFGGNPVQLSGTLPEVGDEAIDFSFVKEDLSNGNLSDFQNKIKVIIAIPSIETGVCQKESRVFNEKLDQMENVIGLVISKDLPFALKRFCEGEGLNSIVAVSDFRHNEFGKNYKLELTSLAFEGLFARVVFVVDTNNRIVFREIVGEIGDEPDYDAIMAAVKQAK